MNHRYSFLRLCAVLLFVVTPFLYSQQLEVHVINVGWGGSLFIKGPNGTTVLIEAGNTGKGTSAVVPYLQSIGVAPSAGFDYTVVGHQHADHLGGIDEVINAGYDVRIKNYYNGSTYTSGAITQWNDAAATTTAGALETMPVGSQIDLGNGARIVCVARNGSIIGGGTVSVSDENDRSIALLVQYNGFEFLWASDMGGGSIDNSCTGRSTSQTDVESYVVQAISPGGAFPLITAGGIDILYANHHGSESSTNNNWMNLSQPAIALISTGAGQTTGWDLPRKDVVENVLLAQASTCVTVPPAIVLQTEEGSPAGSLTSTAGFCVGNITVVTTGTGSFTVAGDGQVTQGPNEVSAAGLPLTLNTDDSTPPPDTTPPVLSNVQATGISTNSATITWTTDEASNSFVEFGLTTSYGSSQSSATMVTGHGVLLSGLSVGTLYHYRVSSMDGSNNTSVSGDFTVTTSSGGSSGGVVLSEIFYDTPGTEPDEEWVELYNSSATPVDISGWTITDNNGAGTSFAIPSGTSIGGASYVTIGVNATAFQSLYGYQADLYGSLPSLNNTGESLILKNASGVEQDAVAWEGGSTGGIPAGWGSTSLPNAPTGSSVVRTDPSVDSDSYADWSVTPNNGDPQTQFLTTEYTPTSMTISVGTVGSGTYTDLATDNGGYATVKSTTSGTRTSDWYATMQIQESQTNVTGMIVTYNGKHNKTSVTQKLYLFNYSTGAWNQIDSRTVGTTDITITYSPATPAHFVSITGLIRLRILSTKGSNFTTSGDYVHVTVTSTSGGSSAPEEQAELLDRQTAVPFGYGLGLNYPNPFNPSTVIPFDLGTASHVHLAVYDISGRMVSELVNGHRNSGHYEVRFNASALPSGTYFYRIEAGAFTSVRKLILSK